MSERGRDLFFWLLMAIFVSALLAHALISEYQLRDLQHRVGALEEQVRR